jgi:hypothetical protein
MCAALWQSLSANFVPTAEQYGIHCQIGIE